MGSMMSSAMAENFEKTKSFQAKTQQAMLERQMEMQNYMRELQMSMAIARGREMFNWIASFYGLATVGMMAGFAKKRNQAVLVPFVPLTFIVAYQYDLCYGDKMMRIRAEADKILKEEQKLLEIPRGLPTVEELDRRRSEK